MMVTTTHALHFDQVMRQIHDLPALPAIVQELMQDFSRDDADIQLITRKVSRDQALSAKTLRFANSSFYGLQTRVTTIQQAVTLIGVDAVRHVVTANAIADAFPAHKLAGLDFKTMWRHSVATAVCARVLARHLHVNQDYAFTAGLLHDIGRLVLATHFPLEYEAVIAYRKQHDCQWIDAERAVMGVDYARTGSALAVHWNFSESIRNAISGHAQPEHQKIHSLASIVHVANAIVRALDLSGNEEELVPPVSQTAWDDLGFGEEECMQIFHETEVLFEEVGRVLINES